MMPPWPGLPGAPAKQAQLGRTSTKINVGSGGREQGEVGNCRVSDLIRVRLQVVLCELPSRVVNIRRGRSLPKRCSAT
jgi:hypothetical protein